MYMERTTRYEDEQIDRYRQTLWGIHEVLTTFTRADTAHTESHIDRQIARQRTRYTSRDKDI